MKGTWRAGAGGRVLLVLRVPLSVVGQVTISCGWAGAAGCPRWRCRSRTRRGRTRRCSRPGAGPRRGRRGRRGAGRPRTSRPGGWRRRPPRSAGCRGRVRGPAPCGCGRSGWLAVVGEAVEVVGRRRQPAGSHLDGVVAGRAGAERPVRTTCAEAARPRRPPSGPSPAGPCRSPGVAASVGVTRVHRMTLRGRGSPEATPCRKYPGGGLRSRHVDGGDGDGSDRAGREEGAPVHGQARRCHDCMNAPRAPG